MFGVPRDAPEALLRVRFIVSSTSSVESLVIETVKVLSAGSLSAHLKIPETAVAVALLVAY